jgi:hypothetical protein
MKRKAFLIGNTNGLPGVNIDLINFQTFLISDTGGAWHPTEIEIIKNPSRSNLLARIELAKLEKFDYVIVHFSGHGGHQRRTVLELNKSGDTIEDRDLHGIAQRQLSIHDCCRTISTQTNERAALDSSDFMLKKSFDSVRLRYDRRILQAIPQQALLYSCSIGQTALDTSDGGLYTLSLLAAARIIDDGSEFKTVGDAHQIACIVTSAHAARQNRTNQNPESILPRCLTQQQLILSIRA